MKSTQAILLVLYSIFAYSQFLPVSQDQQMRVPKIQDCQAAFNDWQANRDLMDLKGWKWYKRWEEEAVKNVRADGSFADPEIFVNEVLRLQQGISPANTATSVDWLPVGPTNLPTSVNPEREVGIGRINCVTFHPTNPDILWVGVAQGGVWKSTNGGQSWFPLTDNLPMLRISDIAIDRQRPDTMYISVGDYGYLGISLSSDGRKRHTHYGLGVYKTMDGGNTWNPTGLSFVQTDFDYSLTRRVFVNSSDPNEILAGGTSGIHKSYDGGANWVQVLDSLIWDIEQGPSNPDIIYASTGYVGYIQAGSASIMKSSDFGSTWTVLNTGIPLQNAVQRIEIGIAPSDPNYVYALTCGMDRGFYGMYLSTDAGTTWNLQSTSPNILEWYEGTDPGGQGTYDLVIHVDPTDKLKVYAGGINLWGSTDGGITWNGISYWRNEFGPSIHADQHFLDYNPLSSKFYICNDGGIYSTNSIDIGSWDSTFVSGYEWPTQWTNLGDGMMTTSFYRLGTSNDFSGHVIGGAQDNSTYYNNTSDWLHVFGGDGMECALDPNDSTVVYGSSQYGWLYKSTNGGVNYGYISWDILNTENGGWVTPYLIDQQDPNTLLSGFENVWKSIDGGSSWNQISDFANLGSLAAFNVSSALATCPTNPNYIYVAKRIDHQLGIPSELWVSDDGGNTWQNKTTGLPDSLYFTYIAVDDDNPGTAWITCAGFYDGLKVFKTADGGSSWQNISLNLPNLPVNCVVQHNNVLNNPLYIGMDVGVYYFNDTLNDWQLLNQGLPNVIVSELEIHYPSKQLYAATFGRGIWKSDLEDTDSTSSVSEHEAAAKLSIYPNPVSSALNVEFDAFKEEKIKVEIIDIAGKTISSYSVQVYSGTNKIEFNVPQSSGIYYVKLSFAGGWKALKFMVE